MGTADQLLDHAGEMNARLSEIAFDAVHCWRYNPLEYAWEAYRTYTQRFAENRKKVLFLGMNPGPWGMTQTGIPFGEIAAVRDWMGIEVPVGKPLNEHPKRPVEGFSCKRSEVSGRRLWGLMAARFGSAEIFFRDHFVINYCPLIFMEEGGRNLTPDKLFPHERHSLDRICDEHLLRVVETLDPDVLVGVGKYAERKFSQISGSCSRPRRVTTILHPSPASPAANRGWEEQASAQLRESGIWI